MLDNNYVIDAINKYYDDANTNTSTINLVLDINKIFNMTKTATYIYNEKIGKYLKAYEYMVDEDKFTNGTEMLNEVHKEYVNTLTDKINEDTKKFLSLFKDKNYLYTDNYKSIKKELGLVEFIADNEDDIKEIYIFAMNYSSFFGYMVFERSRDTNLSKQEINTLTAMCKVFDSNISKYDIVEKYEADLLIKNIILNNENVPMLVIEKDTFRVLYVNDLYIKNFRNIKVGEIHQLLLDKEARSPIINDLLISDANHSKHQWLRKGLPFKFNNGIDAYMVYFKDNIDYVNQVNAVDNLTQAILFRGFEEYYNNFLLKDTNDYALCTIDIDKFKYINNMFGYNIGDKILVDIATVIREFIISSEIFCRINEEKFAIFLRYKNADNLNDRIKELSAKFTKMKESNFKEIKITIIGGVTLVDKKLPLNTLIDQATTARKSAKGSHKNNFAYYNAEIDTKIKKEMQLEERIPYAIENDEFVPFLQPKFDIETQKICGAEALVRWITEDGMIYPDEFIPLFEKNGFILTLDFIIYEKVMKYIKTCIDSNKIIYPISVNVSRSHIKDKYFMAKFKTLIKKYDVPLKYLELEITESVFVEDKKELINFVDEIKKNLIKVSIDDFGTAYSSLQNLTEIDIDILKIDKGFLDNIDTSLDVVTKDEILIKNIINLAKELDFNVICEGVETSEQIDLLKKVGCEYGQGYVFAKPMSIEDYEKRFMNNK